MENGFEIVNNVLVGKAYESGINKTCVNKLVMDSFDEAPEFIGQYDLETKKEITFAEMKDRSIRCALWLQKQGIGKDNIVSISTPQQIDDYVPLLATFYIGAIVTPWYHDYSEKTYRQLFELVQPKVMFADRELVSCFSSIAASINLKCTFISYNEHPEFQSLNEILAEQDPEDVRRFTCVELNDLNTRTAAIFFSSGTTGSPKGVCISYETLVNDRMEYIYTTKDINKYWDSSLGWITGTSCLLAAIRYKSKRFFHRQLQPEDTGKMIEKYKISWMFIKATRLNHMWISGVFQSYDCSSINIILLAGTKPNLNTLRNVKKVSPHISILNSYGMTEAGGWFTVQKNRCKIDSIGYVVGTVKMRVVDMKTGYNLGPNQKGEMRFKVKNCMLGYYKNPQLSKEIFDEDGWMRSGDEGFYDENGEITLTDRIKRIIKVPGFHVSPSLVENLLMEHPEVAEAAVIGVPHHIDMECIMAFVKLHPGAQVSKEELIELPAKYDKFLRVTGGILFVDELPYNSSGKVVFDELKKMAEKYQANSGFLKM